MSKGYVFKNFTELSTYESEEVLQGRNEEYVRRWMTSERVITADEHNRFMLSLRGASDRLYFRIERARRFVGVYSVTNLSCGSGTGGFWVTKYAQDCLLSLNVAFHGIDFVFKACALERLSGYHLVDNTSVAKLNKLLGFSIVSVPANGDPRMTYLEMTRAFWVHSASRQPKLKKLIEVMESRNKI